ncbi:MAG: cytochrome c family protein [Desulfobacteraceae bacterium]|nr:cytochrome c family protein [Desulfobacteraceae bacterium]
MPVKKELKFAGAAALVCLIVGVVSYGVIQARSPEEPVRVFYECTGENVLFKHMTHSESYGLECMECHHKIAWEGGDKEGQEISCGSCHTGESSRKPALGEKGIFDHDVHAEYYGLSCTDCHHMYDQSSGAAPQNCNACHADTGDEYMPSLADSYHRQCIGCHEDFGTGPATEDCNACHKPRNRTDAFHNQCRQCHEYMGAGPTENDCQRCHGY